MDRFEKMETTPAQTVKVEIYNQTYNIRPDITFAPVDPANLTWPSNRADFDARPTNLTAPTSADFAAGTVGAHDAKAGIANQHRLGGALEHARREP